MRRQIPITALCEGHGKDREPRHGFTPMTAAFLTPEASRLVWQEPVYQGRAPRLVVCAKAEAVLAQDCDG
ncbi:hypothetical protein [Acidiferrobacter sp.]|jgi:hypothetical protein|uniref:hypothetical protein n=1 Tax=Acidiferrobacter sp. TaxID=1872107 RepID=UPI00262BC688|nr:hypothetical protein [Acidiferrobacter sp.]